MFDTSGMALARAYPDNAPEVIKLDVSGIVSAGYET